MSELDIKQKLIDNGLENYIDIFSKNHLFDERVLSEMTNEDYVSIGITIIGDRKKLLLLFRADNNSVCYTNNLLKDAKDTLNEEYINILKNGKEYCYKSLEPNKLLCRKCHSVVSEDSTLCWNCNNNLVEQKKYSSSSTIENEKKEEIISEDKENKGVIYAFLIIVIIVIVFFTYACGSSENESSYNSASPRSYSSSNDLNGVSVGYSDTQLEINTTQTLHDVRIRINNNYIYEVSILPSGHYTVGLATFTDSKGNRFNPFSKKVIGVSIYCDEGFSYFTPK